jgi:CHAD domain-containing protein
MAAATDGRPRELEWQLDAHDLRPVLRWIEAAAGDGGGVSIGSGRTVNQVDTYLDTDDRRLDRAGYSVRVRRARNGRPEATMKSLASEGADADGPRIRLELEEEVDGEQPQAVAHAAGAVGQRVRALAGGRELVPLFDVHTRRRVFPLAAAGEPAGELVLDDTAIRQPGEGGQILGRLRRVEVEAPPEARALVEPLVERLRNACGLHPAQLSKYESGLVAAGMPRREPEAFGRTAIDPGDSIGEVGLAVLRKQFAAMLAKEPGTRLGDDVEELHDMRVATRRMRAALSLFAESLPASVVEQREELAWVGREIGVVRDLDVQLEQLDGWIEALPEDDREPLLRLRALLVEERDAARRTMLVALDSPRYDRFVRRFGSLLRTRSGARTAPALQAAPELVERRHRGLRKASKRIGPEAEPAAYHRMRIAGKRFRYALEFVAPLYPGATQQLVRRTVALQDLLGSYQDADVAIERLRRIAAERGAELGPAAVFAMGEVAERYRQGMAESRGKVEKTFARLEGKPWKRFHRRLAAAAESP